MRAIYRKTVTTVIEVPCPRHVHFNYGVGLTTNKPKEPHKMLELTITNEQKVQVTLFPVTEGGDPAKLDGAPAWSVVSGDSTVEPAEDGMSAFLVSADDPGDTDFMVEADADLGAGVQTISDIVRLHVAGAQAKNLGLSAGTPVLKTPPPPPAPPSA